MLATTLDLGNHLGLIALEELIVMSELQEGRKRVSCASRDGANFVHEFQLLQTGIRERAPVSKCTTYHPVVIFNLVESVDVQLSAQSECRSVW